LPIRYFDQLGEHHEVALACTERGHLRRVPRKPDVVWRSISCTCLTYLLSSPGVA
jgi:hypothetical protein